MWILQFLDNLINQPIHILKFKSSLLTMSALFSKTNYTYLFIIKLLVLANFQLTNLRLRYSPLTFKYNAPCKNYHYDTKIEPL
jgi:hypothetical protein